MNVYEVTAESSHLAYKLESEEWLGHLTSVAVSESIPDSILVVCADKPHVYQYPCHEAKRWVKKHRIRVDWRVKTVLHIVANANTAVIMSNGNNILTVLSLPYFQSQSQVQINFIPQDISISTDSLLIMGENGMTVKQLGDLSQDLCWIKPPDEETIFHCVSFTNNARGIYAACSQGPQLSVYKYMRGSGSNPSYSDTGIVIKPIPFTCIPLHVFLAVNSDGSLLAMTDSTCWGATHIYSHDYTPAPISSNRDVPHGWWRRMYQNP